MKSPVEQARENIDRLQAELSYAQQVLRRAEEEAKPKEPAAGSWVRILATFPGGRKTYTYLALRVPESPARTDSWYVTGKAGKYTWEDVLRLVRHAETIQIDRLRPLN